MGRPKKYQSLDLYAPQRAYFKTEKGVKAIERYENSENRKIKKLEWQRRQRGTIVDKRQWFIDTYGDVEKALALLDLEQKFTIELYYGLMNNQPLSQKEIADKLGTSQPQISRIKKAALQKLDAMK